MTKGSYIILIEVFPKSTNGDGNIKIQVGSLGLINFAFGYYCYVGSAMGTKKSSTCLENRIRRHLRSHWCPKQAKNKPKTHWHIDYLLNDSNSSIIRFFIIPSRIKDECEIAEIIKNYADGHMRDFGSSDCSCRSHLFFFKNLKNIPMFFRSDSSLI